eukprot:TRINITY_DN8385_c0_g1_i7.p1 TRINITY_DN8385_c0_g1~~TRINITY_DN8385_c0_g1_i7.p1  ORF type:complete len:720 (+),score=178.67 TRINITY_DN8385_c0_g1_i7:114-2162(+)
MCIRDSSTTSMMTDIQSSKSNKSTSSSISDGDHDSSKHAINIELPKGHANVTNGDPSKCPYYSIQEKMKDKQTSQKSEADTGKCPYNKEGEVSEKPKKEKKPKSGCPFMTSEKKKNPPLAPMKESYDIPYISVMKYLLRFRGFMNKDAFNNKRQSFDEYPIYLQHTVFHDDEKMAKIRTLEVSHRFFIYDKFREQGNKCYNKGEYDEALKLYERALSCFKWLDQKKAPPMTEEEKEKDPLAYTKSLLHMYTDENVTLHDGEEVTDQMEIDMRKSMLLQVYMNLCICYMALSHFKMALIAIEDAFKISDKNSQLLYRRSQVRSFNKGATLEDLYKAKADVELAIELRRVEKLFQQEGGILKLLNLHNAEEAYVEQAHYVEKRLKERREWETQCLKMIFAREKHIELVEERLRNEGKLKDEGEEATVSIQEDHTEYEIAREVVTRYMRVIEFYQESQKKDQVDLARKEIVGSIEIYEKMKYFYTLDFKEFSNNEIVKELLKEIEIDMTNEKIIKRMDRIKVAKAKEVFESANYNLEVFQYALDEHFRKKEEEEKRKKEEEAEAAGVDLEAATPSKGFFKGFFKLEFLLQLMIIVLLFVVFYYFNKNNQYFTKFFSRKQWRENTIVTTPKVSQKLEELLISHKDFSLLRFFTFFFVSPRCCLLMMIHQTYIERNNPRSQRFIQTN